MTKNAEKGQWVGWVHTKNTSDNGNKTHHMGMDNIFGMKTRPNIKYSKICIRDIGKMEKDKVSGPFFIRMAAGFKDTFLKIRKKVLE